MYSPSEIINDLDWTSTPDRQSILAVGFSHHIELLCQQRMTYFNEEPGWTMCYKVEIAPYVVVLYCLKYDYNYNIFKGWYHIRSVIRYGLQMDHCLLEQVIKCSYLVNLVDYPAARNSTQTVCLNMLQGIMGRWKTITRKCFFNVFCGVSILARSDSHNKTYMTVAEKVETVKAIIVNLANDIQATRVGDKLKSSWEPIPIENFLRKDGTFMSVR